MNDEPLNTTTHEIEFLINVFVYVGNFKSAQRVASRLEQKCKKAMKSN